MTRIGLVPFILGAGLTVLVAPDLAAQEFRGVATTSVQYIEMRPVQLDTVPRASVVEGPNGGLTFEGRPVFCVGSRDCTFFRPAGVQSSAAGTTDLSLTAWGFGMRGLSAVGLLRVRYRVGGDFVWPRSDDEFDAILAYAQLLRGRWRIRLGRQETLSGLGFWGFDGASVRWQPARAVSVEAYGGRSLARGLSDPRNEALRGLEDFIPDRDAYLFGGNANFEVGLDTDVGLRYQREIWSDRSGLIQERASLEVHSLRFRPLRVRGALDWDVAFDVLGKSHLTLEVPVASRLLVAATAKRYVPYFELSTIWGFFSPVAYHEGQLELSYASSGRTARISGGWRRYQDTEAPVIFSPLERDGWRAEASYAGASGSTFSYSARYQIEWGVGAFLSSLDARVNWRVREGLELGLNGATLQQFQEFRVGDGRVWGIGGTAALDLGRGVRLMGGGALYRHDPRRGAVDETWNQLRAWSNLSIPIGQDPGRARRRLRR